MVYKNGFVVAIKNSSKEVLRENDGKVYIPYYEEYSLLLKNNTFQKAIATIKIDGEDVLNGKKIIVDKLNEVSIERFVKNLTKGRKFQFVPNSDSRIKYKRNHPDLGIIEVRFQKEKDFHQDFTTLTKSYLNESFPLYNYGITSKTSHSLTTNANIPVTYSCCNFGGTAKGSRSTQQFSESLVGILDDEVTTIRLRLLPTESQATVKNTNKIYCIHCGVKNPRKANYCHQCGNKIEK